jgi:hypothetical protein
MRTLLLSATVLFAFVVASAQPEAQAQRSAPKLRCEVYVGVHIAFQNMGAVPIPSGTKVHWSLPNGAGGDYTLPVTLSPTAAVLLEYALPTPVTDTRRCSVKFI